MSLFDDDYPTWSVVTVAVPIPRFVIREPSYASISLVVSWFDVVLLALIGLLAVHVLWMWLLFAILAGLCLEVAVYTEVTEPAETEDDGACGP